MMEQGTILDNTYKIVKAIGVGGGGEIYLADHLRLEKAVVIKKIRESMQGVIENRGEADILKRLSHPYLPQVYDFFIENSQVYTVMEYIAGENFQQLLQKGKHFETGDIVKWGTQLSEVLAYLHARKPAIIHRDIKPANIMLTEKGNVCLIDFNVSFDNDKDSKNIIAHSDGYSPPEQYGLKRAEEEGQQAVSQVENEETEILKNHSGGGDSYSEFTEILSDASNGILSDVVTEILAVNNGSASAPAEEADGIKGNGAGSSCSCQEAAYDIPPASDERSDIYSLGATLYHFITLKKPEKATEKVKPLSQCNVKVSDGMIYIIEKAMQLQPEKRFQTAEKMHEAFLNIKKLDHEYISYSFLRDLLVGIMIAAACVSTICTALGYRKMQAEDYNAYVQQVEAGIELQKQGLMKEAAEACKEAIDMRPEEIAAYTELMNVNYMQQRYAEGIAVAVQGGLHGTEVTEDNKEQLAKVHFLEGECYVGLEEYNLAVESYRKAMVLQPEQGEYYTRCAIALAYEGNHQEASKFLENAFQKGITDASVYLTKGEIALSQKKYEEAEEMMKTVLEMTEESDLLYHAYLMGIHIYEENGAGKAETLDKKRELLEDAVNTLESSYLLSISEELANVYYELAREEKDEKREEDYYNKALANFDDIIKAGYKNIHILQNTALINQALGNYGEAEGILFEMIEAYPEEYRGYMYITLLYSEIQNAISIEKRDYSAIFDYYDKAESKYQNQLKSGGTIDTQMQILKNMIEDLKENS